MDKSLLRPKLPLGPEKRWSQILVFLVAIIIPFLPWNSFTIGNGQVTALNPEERIQTVTSPVNGFVSKWYVQEGSKVSKGDVIARMQDVDPGIRERYERELEAAQSAVKSAELVLTTAKLNLERQKNLFKQGLAARKDFESAKIDVSKYAMDLAKSQATLTKAEAQLERQLQKIVSPQNGYITRILPGERGQLVKAGTSLAVLTPIVSNPAVEIWVDGNDTAMLSPGQKAQVQFEGWPSLQIPGWPGVAVGTFPARVHLVDAASSYKGKFRVLLIPDGSWPVERFLRPGIHTKAYINLRESFILREIWRLFTGLPPVTDPFEDELYRALSNPSINDGRKAKEEK